MGAGSVFVLKSAGAFLMVIGQIAAARLLGAEEYGRFAYAQSVLLVITIFTILGYDLSLLRFVPEYRVQQKWSELKGVLRASFRQSAAASLLITAIGGAALMTPWAASEGRTAALRIMLLSVPLYTLTMLRQAALRGLRHAALAELPESLLRPVLFIALLPAAAVLVPKMNAAAAWWCWLSVVAVAFLFGSLLLVRRLPPELGAVNAAPFRREWRTVSLDMMWMNAMNVIFNQASVVLLGFTDRATEVALFSAANRLAFFVSFAMLAVSSIVAPMISELYHSGRMDELERTMKLSTAFLAASALIAGVLLLGWGRDILGLFGKPFRGAYIYLLLLMLGHTFKSFSGLASYLLNMSGRQRLTRRLMLLFVILHLALNALLIPLYGALGAAIAAAATMVFWNLTLAIAAAKVVGVDPTFLSLLKRGHRMEAA